MWTQIITPDPTYCGSPYAYSQRFYCRSGENWPIFGISLYYPWHDDKDGIEIGINMKNAPDKPWYKTSLPRELVQELIDMLNELDLKKT